MRLRGTVAVLAATLVAGCTAAPAQIPARLHHATARPRCGPGFTVGADLYADHDYSAATAGELGARDLAWIAGTLKVCAVQIDWNLYSGGNAVYQGTDSAPPAVIAALTRIAQHDHLAVTYRVMFSIPAPPGRTGRIAPSDPGGWFTSLLAAERPYLNLAQRYRVSEFIAGNEQTPIEANPRWGPFYQQAAHIYHGILSYATWGGRPGYAGVTDGNLRQLPPVRNWGITAYPLVNLPASAPQNQVTAAWTAYLRSIPSWALTRIELDEVGIPAATGAYERPWDWTAFAGPADNTVQARWFTAACTAARNDRMRGIWFFAVFLEDNPAHPYPGLAKFERRPAAEAAIRACAEESG